ncbi:MAG: hypothetical protein H6739_41130 [Alphaproteobacteria bacterium]|nr:hypothetical protein [Alphaproteobacteria bacterium]
MNRTLILLGFALFACKGGDDTPTDDTSITGDDSGVDDTADDTGVDDTAVECLAQPAELSPDDGENNVFYRDPVTVRFTSPVPSGRASFRLYHRDTNEEQAHTVEWNESGEIATLIPEGGYLNYSWAYGLEINVCDQTFNAAFNTNDYGAPLDITDEELVSRTYVIEFGDVNFTRPEGFGALLALYIDVPVLVGVNSVEGQVMSLVGAQGRVTSQGEYAQRRMTNSEWVPTWPFTGIDFSESPFFSADTSSINLVYNGVDIPVYNFHLEGTFAADANSFAGGTIWGLGDTRYMGTFFGEPDNQDYVCDLVSSVGASCEVCPSDGENYCLFIQGEEIVAALVPDLVLEEIDENGPVTP